LQNIWHWLAPPSRSLLGWALGPIQHINSYVPGAFTGTTAKLLALKLGREAAQRWRRRLEWGC